MVLGTAHRPALQAGVGHSTVRAQDKDRRLSITFLFIEEKVVGFDHFTAQARQHRKAQVMLSCQLLAILRRIGADRQNLGVLLMELGQFLLVKMILLATLV